MQSYNYQSPRLNRSKTISIHSYSSIDLQKVRKQKQERSQILDVIVDVKLREIGKLETKKEVLAECQNWVANKVLFYMNLLDQAEVRYYMQIEELTQKLRTKQTIFQQQQKTIKDFNSIKQAMEKNILFLRQQNNKLQKTLSLQFQWKDKDSKKYSSIAKLESQNRLLKTRIETLQKQTTIYKQELNRAKQDVVSKQEDIVLMQNQVIRLKARLEQNSQQNNNLKCFPSYKVCYAYSVTLKNSQFKQAKTLKSMGLRQVMIDGLIISNSSSKHRSIQQDNLQFIKTARKRDSGSQTSSPYLWKFKLEDIVIGATKDRGSYFLRNFVKKPKTNVLEEAKNANIIKLKQYYKRQINRLQKEFKQQMLKLKVVNTKRLELVIQEKKQLEALFASRPSRQDDIEYIHELLDQNKQLVEISSQSNKKAEGAYVSMNQIKADLERYKNNFTIQIRPPTKKCDNIRALTPPSTFFAHRVLSQSRKSRSKSRQQKMLITTILGESLETPRQSNRKLKSSLSVYRDEYRLTIPKSIL